MAEGTMPPPTDPNAVAQPTEELCETKPAIVEKFKMSLEFPMNDSKKFNRIRNHVQKLNEEFLATLYETEKRHKKEVEGYKAAMAAQEKNHQEEFYTVEQQYKAGQKKEISELYSELKAVERSHRETYSNAEMRHKSEVRILRAKIDANEKFYQDALQKAEKSHKAESKALHGKLRAQSKRHEESKKRAEEKIKTLTQKLLGKHDDMEAFQTRALKEVDTVVEALGCSKVQVAHLMSALEKLKKKYSEEYEKRKADQKKIVSLRKMIEQYDGTDETTSDHEISEVKSDGSTLDESAETPAEYYHKNIATNGEEFEKLRDAILTMIPEEIKSGYRQVGFYEKGGLHLPVLGLSPFDVPPGSLRDEWLEKAKEFIGIFYYGETVEARAYDLIPAGSFIPYKDGVVKERHIVPVSIIEKQQSGQEISDDEKRMSESIKKVNMEARAAPEDREHLLQGFKEDFTVGGPTVRAQLELEKLRDSLKAKLSFGDNTAERAELLAGMEHIMKEGAEDEEEVQSVESSEEKEGEEQKEQVSWKAKSNYLTVDTADTVDTLDDQVNSFINELSASRTKKVDSREESQSEIESRDACEAGARDARDDSFEQMKKSNIVQQRLAMFNNGVPAQRTPKGSNVETGGNPKNVMQMWKDKTDQATPKQGNGALPKTFAFNDVNPEGPTAASSSPRKLIKKTTSSSSISTGGSTSSGRRVTIPKKIVLKIEAGEKLSAEEREILEGIQKFNAVQTPTAKSLSMSAE